MAGLATCSLLSKLCRLGASRGPWKGRGCGGGSQRVVLLGCAESWTVGAQPEVPSDPRTDEAETSTGETLCWEATRGQARPRTWKWRRAQGDSSVPSPPRGRSRPTGERGKTGSKCLLGTLPGEPAQETWGALYTSDPWSFSHTWTPGRLVKSRDARVFEHSTVHLVRGPCTLEVPPQAVPHALMLSGLLCPPLGTSSRRHHSCIRYLMSMLGSGDQGEQKGCGPPLDPRPRQDRDQPRSILDRLGSFLGTGRTGGMGGGSG